MEAATVSQATEAKYLVRNQTAGYVGVVVYDDEGKKTGVNIDPHGTLYMSERDMIATARAPKRPEDNPFEEQTFVGFDPEIQGQKEFTMRPLVLESDERTVPTNDRYVPTQVPEQDGQPAVAQASSAEQAAPAGPPSTGSSATPPAPPAPARVAPTAGPAVRTGPTQAPQAPSQTIGLGGVQEPAGGQEEAQSWVTPPEAPGRVLPGHLGGEAGDGNAASAAPEPTNHPATDTGERFTPSVIGAQAAPQQPGGEEHAAKVDPAVGEETGAARPPQGAPAEGEYASAEEVGSPDAPAHSDDATLIGG